MSKYSQELAGSYPTTKIVRKLTKDLLESGNDIAFESIHGKAGFRRLKHNIKEVEDDD